MKRVLIVVLLVVAAATLGLWRSQGGVRSGLSRAVGISSDNSQGEGREEIRKSFELLPGARVEVQGINGKVEIQTSDTKTAEVYVLRTGKNSDSLTRRDVIIEQTSTGLLVKAKQARDIGFWAHLFGSNPHEDVTIKAPRQIALALKGINGGVTTGDIDGTIEAKGINGRIELGQASESAEISGINGNLVVGLRSLGDRGANIKGINGGIELRLGSSLNADLTARGLNGNVRSDIPEVTVEKEEAGSRYSAHIGSGGSQITLSGINGNVRLTRAANSTETSVAIDKKTEATKKATEPGESRLSKSAQ
jgi:hypothetical protein